MKLELYIYEKCQTCRKARKNLEQQGLNFQVTSIVRNPPSKQQLREVVACLGGDLRKIFNTSGRIYRTENISDKIVHMTEDEALDLLRSNGMLIKRPLLYIPGYGGLVGYQESQWLEIPSLLHETP